MDEINLSGTNKYTFIYPINGDPERKRHGNLRCYHEIRKTKFEKKFVLK